MDVVIVAGVFGAAILARPDMFAVGVLALALIQPSVCAVGLAATVLVVTRGSGETEPSEGAYLHAVAMELRAGASLRSALIAGADRAPDLALGHVARLAAVGAPIGLLADSLAGALPLQGRVAAAALKTAGTTGGQVAVVFDNLAHVAAEDREQRRELRAATAQARISAWIVGGVPAGYLGFLLFTGQLIDLLDSPLGVGIVAVGVGFLATGTFVVAAMMRRALT